VVYVDRVSVRIRCTGCVKWIHKKYCGLAGKLQEEDASIYRCHQCVGYIRDILPNAAVSGKVAGVFMLVTADKLELIDKLFYLGVYDDLKRRHSPVVVC